MVVAITIDTKKVQFMLTGYQRTIPKASIKGIKKLASFAAMTYLQQARKAGIRDWRGKFAGTFQKQITKPTKLGKNSYGVSVAPLRRGGVNYAIALDRMRPHWVKLRKGRLITKWAQDKLGLAGAVATKVFVKPHPYINNANRIIGRNVKRIVESEINKAIKRKGK